MCTPALQRRGALLATAGTNKTLRPTPPQQKGGAASSGNVSETAKAIGPWPLRAPSPTLNSTEQSPHTTSKANWDSGINLRKPRRIA